MVVLRETEHIELNDTSAMREEIRNSDDVRFVDRTEYCELLTSSRSLTRCDLPAARLRGVYDAELELQYLIEEERLFPN